MSRFNAQAQKGYYKTPTHLLPVISRYVSCSDPENARVLDFQTDERIIMELSLIHI